MHNLYRPDAPITSIDAAESIDVSRLEMIVLEAIKKLDGCISDEVRMYCSKHHGIDTYSSVTARFASLRNKGLITYSGDIRKGHSGRGQRVMVAT